MGLPQDNKGIRRCLYGLRLTEVARKVLGARYRPNKNIKNGGNQRLNAECQGRRGEIPTRPNQQTTLATDAQLVGELVREAEHAGVPGGQNDCGSGLAA